MSGMSAWHWNSSNSCSINCDTKQGSSWKKTWTTQMDSDGTSTRAEKAPLLRRCMQHLLRKVHQWWCWCHVLEAMSKILTWQCPASVPHAQCIPMPFGKLLVRSTSEYRAIHFHLRSLFFGTCFLSSGTALPYHASLSPCAAKLHGASQCRKCTATYCNNWQWQKIPALELMSEHYSKAWRFRNGWPFSEVNH